MQCYFSRIALVVLLCWGMLGLRTVAPKPKVVYCRIAVRIECPCSRIESYWPLDYIAVITGNR